MLGLIKRTTFIVLSFVSSFLVYNTLSIEESNKYLTLSSSYINSGNKVTRVSNFFDEPIMHLSIPKINVSNNIYNINSINNNIDLNVEIMKESDMPWNEKGNVILGGHSGSGRLAFFKDFINLDIGDKVILTYNGNDYVYQITSIYNDDKNGSILIRRNIDKETITLFTCNPLIKSNYLVVVGEMINKENV